MNRSVFYNIIRSELFNTLSQSQVLGIENILNEWDASRLTDKRWLAYMLGTVYHETAQTMRPIEEYGRGKGKPYGNPAGPYKLKYYGRGLVQLTWYYNYYKMSKLIGVDLVKEPELACVNKIAVKIMFEGMTKGDSSFGDFTGKCLEDYFNNKTEDWINARRIINGIDKADKIARKSKIFYSAILAAT